MEALRAYRDDGPLATLLGGVLRPLAPRALALGLVGALGLAIVLAVTTGDEVAPVVAAAVVFVSLASVGAADVPGRLAWLLPPLLRAGEYGFVLALGIRAGPSALPVIYGLLAAVAFHQYDIVYRLRHQRVAPPRWVTWLGGGWDGRMLLVALLFAVGLLESGAVALAVWCAALFVPESIASWVRIERFGHGRRPAATTGSR